MVRVFGHFIGQILCFWLKYRFFLPFQGQGYGFWPLYRSNPVFFAKRQCFCHFRVRVFGPFIGQILCLYLKYCFLPFQGQGYGFRTFYRSNPVFLTKIHGFLQFQCQGQGFWPFYRSNTVFLAKIQCCFFAILGLGLGFLNLLQVKSCVFG